MLFNEPKLLKFQQARGRGLPRPSFSALQRAEIAEILQQPQRVVFRRGFSALQRAEIAETARGRLACGSRVRFSALQRAEIAEIGREYQLTIETTSSFQCSSTSRNC